MRENHSRTADGEYRCANCGRRISFDSPQMTIFSSGDPLCCSDRCRDELRRNNPDDYEDEYCDEEDGEE